MTMYFTLFVVLVLTVQVECRFQEKPDRKSELGAGSYWMFMSPLPDKHGDNVNIHFSGIPFTLSRDMDNGETEYRVYHNDVVAMETVLTSEGESALHFRMVTNGHNLMKLVYSRRGKLVECDIMKKKRVIYKFLDDFMENNDSFIEHSADDNVDVSWIVQNTELFDNNDTLSIIESGTVGEPYYTMTNYEQLKNDCIHVGHRTRETLKSRGISTHSNWVRFRTTEARNITQEFLPRTMNSTGHRTPKSRKNRDTPLPVLRWCGTGSGLDYESLGLRNLDPDGCCTEHDQCKHYIEPMTWGYEMFNPSHFTVSHCLCDKQLKACLMRTDDNMSTMVGRVYFDVLGIKCFEFVEKNVCVSRSMLGVCKRREKQKAAKIRGPLSWP